MELKSFGTSHVDTIITNPNGFVWRFTGFSGLPNRSMRHQSWELICRLKPMYDLPWIIGGAFNEIIHLSEKNGGLNRCSYSMNLFGEVLNQCGLIDLGYIGPSFTWSNNQKQNYVLSRRGCLIVLWLMIFERLCFLRPELCIMTFLVLTIEF